MRLPWCRITYWQSTKTSWAGIQRTVWAVLVWGFEIFRTGTERQINHICLGSCSDYVSRRREEENVRRARKKGISPTPLKTPRISRTPHPTDKGHTFPHITSSNLDNNAHSRIVNTHNYNIKFIIITYIVVRKFWGWITSHVLFDKTDPKSASAETCEGQGNCSWGIQEDKISSTL